MHYTEGLLYDTHQTRMFNYIVPFVYWIITKEKHSADLLTMKTLTPLVLHYNRPLVHNIQST